MTRSPPASCVRDGDTLRRPGTAAAAPDPDLAAAMDRLEAALATTSPPPLADAARATRCPPAGIRALEKAARIVVLEPDLAYAMSTYKELAGRALAMATTAAAHPGRVPGCDRHEPQVRDGDPRGPRSKGDPAPDTRRPHARAEGACPGRSMTERVSRGHPCRRAVIPVRSRQARRADRRPPDARPRDRAGS